MRPGIGVTFTPGLVDRARRVGTGLSVTTTPSPTIQRLCLIPHPPPHWRMIWLGPHPHPHQPAHYPGPCSSSPPLPHGPWRKCKCECTRHPGLVMHYARPRGWCRRESGFTMGSAGWGMVAASKTDCVGWANVHWRMHHLGAHLLANPGKRQGEAWQIMASISTSSRVSPWICPMPVISMMICWLIVETLESAPPNRLDQSRTFPKLRRILLQMPPRMPRMFRRPPRPLGIRLLNQILPHLQRGRATPSPGRIQTRPLR